MDGALCIQRGVKYWGGVNYLHGRGTLHPAWSEVLGWSELLEVPLWDPPFFHFWNPGTGWSFLQLFAIGVRIPNEFWSRSSLCVPVLAPEDTDHIFFGVGRGKSQPMAPARPGKSHFFEPLAKSGAKWGVPFSAWSDPSDLTGVTVPSAPGLDALVYFYFDALAFFFRRAPKKQALAFFADGREIKKLAR